MKKIGTLLLVAIFICFWSCSKDDEVETTDLTVKVAFPETYLEDFAEGATVELVNLETMNKLTRTSGPGGTVLFEGLLAGTYNITASLTLSETQAETLTGIKQQIILSGNENNIIIAGALPMEKTLQLIGGKAGDLVFKEIYYTGSRTPSGGSYFLDQFYEIFNNSTETIYADGLILALVVPVGATSSIPGWSDDPDYVYISSAWRVPGSGTDHPIEPGKSFIISQNGTNHKEDPNGNPNVPYAGSIADFETFVDREDTRDVDNAGVPNMEMLYHASGFYFLASVMGPAVIIFRVDDFGALPGFTMPGSTSSIEYIQLPSALIIDGVETGRDANSVQYKRLPASVDAGMIWCSGTYVSESIRRKTDRMIGDRRVLKDTNNTTNDFEVLTTPTPRSFD